MLATIKPPCNGHRSRCPHCHHHPRRFGAHHRHANAKEPPAISLQYTAVRSRGAFSRSVVLSSHTSRCTPLCVFICE